MDTGSKEGDVTSVLNADERMTDKWRTPSDEYTKSIEQDFVEDDEDKQREKDDKVWYPEYVNEEGFSLYNTRIPRIDTIKLLGLNLDPYLSWLPHIKNIKAKCLQNLNILTNFYRTQQRDATDPRFFISTYL